MLPLILVTLSADESFYQSKGANKEYAESSIIERVENVTLAECAQKCHLNDEGKHTAFHAMTEMYILLKTANFSINNAQLVMQ